MRFAKKKPINFIWSPSKFGALMKKFLWVKNLIVAKSLFPVLKFLEGYAIFPPFFQGLFKAIFLRLMPFPSKSCIFSVEEGSSYIPVKDGGLYKQV